MAERVIIEHKDGRNYAVLPADFHDIYEPEGFKVVSYDDGSEYEPPKKPRGNDKKD